MPKRNQATRRSLTVNTRNLTAANTDADEHFAVHAEIDLAQLPPMSPLTDTSDLEDELLKTRTPTLLPSRAPSTRKRKAPAAFHDSPPPKRLKKQAATAAGHAKRPRVSEPLNPIQHATWKWNLTTLASRKYIFVRLNERGIPAEHADSAGYWWPAKVIIPLSMSQISATLFGNDGRGRRTVSFKASEGNTRLFTPRPFTKHNFASPPELLGRLARSWLNACKYLSKDEKGIRSNDDELLTPVPLPLPLPSLSPVSPATTQLAKRSKPLKVWAPPLPDPSIAIPGEKVLTRMPRCDKSSPHWPAIVKSYVQPTKPTHVPRYELELFNGQVEVVERSYFFLRHESGYYTCKIGKFVSDTVDDDDSDDDSDREDFPHPRTRSLSPLPALHTLPLPQDGGVTFSALPLRAQVALVEPILLAIINDVYPPAHARHLAFVKGGRARRQLSQSAGIRGGLRADEPERIHRMILDWALRDEFSFPLSRNDANVVETVAENVMDSVEGYLDHEVSNDGIALEAPVVDAPSPSDNFLIQSSPSMRNSPAPGPAATVSTEPDMLDSMTLGLDTKTDAFATEPDISTTDLCIPMDSTEIYPAPKPPTSSDLGLPVVSPKHDAPIPLAEFAPSSPTVLGRDHPPDVALSWPSPSLPAYSLAQNPSTFADDPQVPAFSPQDDEASPSDTLPAGEPSSPRARKLGNSHALSPDSESAAETRVDEPSSFRQAGDTLNLRRTGCPSYEALSHHERHLYCLDVLFYETVIQLVLWRAGKRTKPEPLADDTIEEALYNDGVALAQQQETATYKWSWIDDIIARRKREDKKKPAPIVRETHNGKSLRPVAKQISYLEC